MFIDVQKTYEYLDRGICMKIIRGMAWDLKYIGYYIGTGTDRRWFRRQKRFLGILSTHREE